MTKYTVCFVLFDDVVFPVSALSKYYNHDRCEFLVSSDIQEQLILLDKHICSFISKHLLTVRFRILSRSTLPWTQACLNLLPNLKRFIEWHYVGLVLFEDVSPWQRTIELIQKDRRFENYVLLGYSTHEHFGFGHLGNLKMRILQFIQNPSLYSMNCEWERVDNTFQQFQQSQQLIVRNHFVLADMVPLSNQ